MNEKINDLVNERLEKIFKGYPYTKDLDELEEKIGAIISARANEELDATTSEEMAVKHAFMEYGDIDKMIEQTLYSDHQNMPERYHKVFLGHTLDMDHAGVRIDDGKVLNIDQDGVTVNEGKTLRADAQGLKVGNKQFNSTDDEFTSNPDEFEQEFFDYDTEFEDLDTDYTDKMEFPVADVSKIDLSCSSISLQIAPTKHDQVIIKENNPLAKEYRVRTKLEDGTLTIVQKKVPVFLRLAVKVRVLIPQNYDGDLGIYLSRGKILLKNLHKVNKTIVDIQNGLINLDNLDLGELLASNKSGKITMNRVRTRNNLVVDSKSGITSLYGVASRDYRINNDRGTIKGDGISGSGVVISKTGTVRLGFDHIFGDVSVQNNRGTVNLTMPEDDSFKFDLEASNGVVRLNRPASYVHDILSLKEGVVGVDPQHTLTVRAASGTIKVN